MNATTERYTKAQADQMRRDTTIEAAEGGLGKALVAAAPLAETDERFFMDREWLAWFADEHPEWHIVGQMVDLYEDSGYLYVWSAILSPVTVCGDCDHPKSEHQTGEGPWTGFCGHTDCECEAPR